MSGACTEVAPVAYSPVYGLAAKKGVVTGIIDAGWSSLVARRAHNPKVVGSNPAPATNITSLF